MESLGKYLAQSRVENSLSLKEVGKLIKSSDSSLSKLEHGKIAMPSPLILRALADLYNLDIFDLYIRAGYLSAEEIQTQMNTFSGIECLDSCEKECIQNLVDCLNHKKRGI